MKRAPGRRPTRRIHIERLEVDLGSVAPETAEAAARLMGPALARALAGQRVGPGATERIDAGRIRLTGAVDTGTLANELGQRISSKMSGG